MKVAYIKEEGVLLKFDPAEREIALLILRQLRVDSAQQEVLEGTINEIESDLRPKPAFVQHFHFCEECAREVDDRDKNVIRYVQGEKIGWKHETCPPFKSNRR